MSNLGGRPLSESTDGQEQDIKSRTSHVEMTLSEAVNNPILRVGDSVVISDRAYGVFDVLLTSAVTPDTFGTVIGVKDTSISFKLQDTDDLDIVAVGAVEGGVVDSLGAINAAFTLNKGRSVHATGRFLCSDAFEIPEGTQLSGSGIQDIFRYLSGFFSGTVFLVNSTTFCVQPKINTSDFTKRGGIDNLSIFNTNVSNTEGVFNDNGVLFFDMTNVLISSTIEIDGVGIQRKPTTFNGGANTQGGHYKYWRNVSVDGRTVKIGIADKSTGTFEGPNTSIMIGGRVEGWFKAYERTTSATNGANNIVFDSTTFDGVFDTRQDILFVDGATSTVSAVGVYGISRYYAKYLDLQTGTFGQFSGCRFEFSGFPADFDDGTNGTHLVRGCVHVEADAKPTTFNGCAWFSMFLIDKSALAFADRTISSIHYNGGKNTPSGVAGKASQSIPDNSPTLLTWNTPSILRGLTFTSDAYRIYEGGTYLVEASTISTGVVGSTFSRLTVLVNGSPVLSGSYEQFLQISTGVYRSVATAIGLLDVDPNDTISVRMFQISGVSITVENFADATIFNLKKVQ